MHQIRFPLGLHPMQTPPGSLQRSPDPLAVFKGPISKGREGKGEEKGRREGRGEGQGGELGLGRPGTSFFHF